MLDYSFYHFEQRLEASLYVCREKKLQSQVEILCGKCATMSFYKNRDIIFCC